jgi:hypothetical protein
MTIPRQSPRGGRRCLPESPTIQGHILAYASSCGRIVIVDLDSLQVTQVLPYLDTATSYMLSFSENLLFAAPREPEYQVFVLAYARGHVTVQLPLMSPVLFATRDHLVSLRPASSGKKGRLDFYRFQRTLLQDPIDALAGIVMRCEQAAEALKTGATVEEALEMIERETVKPMLDRLDTLDARGRNAVAIYARLLARGIDRIGEGEALLDRLVASAPDDAKLKAYRSAARTRFGIRGVPPNAAADLKGAREVDLGAAASGVPNILLAGNRAYVWQYGATAGGSCADVAFHDRTTLALQTHIPAAGCDDEMQDAVTDVAVGRNAVFIALEYRYQQAGRTDLIVVDKANPKIVGRYDIQGGIWSLAASEEGLLVCGDTLERDCVMRDQADVTAAPKPDLASVPCRPNGAAFPTVVGNRTLLTLNGDRVNVLACNDTLVATGWTMNTVIDLARIDALQKPFARVVGGNSRT